MKEDLLDRVVDGLRYYPACVLRAERLLRHQPLLPSGPEAEGVVKDDLTWHGWIWLLGSWQRVATAPDMRTCSLLTGKEAFERYIPDRLTCLTRGAPPSFTPREP